MPLISIDYERSPSDDLGGKFEGSLIHSPTCGGLQFDTDTIQIVATPTPRPTPDTPNPYVPSVQMMNALQKHIADNNTPLDAHMLGVFFAQQHLIPPHLFGTQEGSDKILFFPGASTETKINWDELVPAHWVTLNKGTKNERKEWVKEQKVPRTLSTKIAYALIKRKERYTWMRFVYERNGESCGGFGSECYWLFLRKAA